MEEKGAKSIILFSKTNITKAAKLEIDQQLMYGKYVIVITKKDLEKIGDNTPYDLLVKKIKENERRQELMMEELI